MHPIPSATWALCHAEQGYIISKCWSKPVDLAQKIPIHPIAQVSEPDMQEYPASPRETHYKSPQTLMSEPQFHATHSTAFSHSIYQPSPYWSIMQSLLPAPKSTFFHSKLHLLHPSKPCLVSLYLVAQYSRNIYWYPFRNSFTIHSLYVTNTHKHIFLQPT